MHKKKNKKKVLEGGGRGCIGDGRRGGSVGGEKGGGKIKKIKQLLIL